MITRSMQLQAWGAHMALAAISLYNVGFPIFEACSGHSYDKAGPVQRIEQVASPIFGLLGLVIAYKDYSSYTQNGLYPRGGMGNGGVLGGIVAAGIGILITPTKTITNSFADLLGVHDKVAVVTIPFLRAASSSFIGQYIAGPTTRLLEWGASRWRSWRGHTE